MGLDAAVAALAALAVAWVFLMNPTLALNSAPLSVRVVVAAYAPISACLVALTAGLAFSTGAKQSRADMLRLAAMAFLLIGDVLFMLLETHAVSMPQRLIEVPYTLAFTAYAISALHPSMRQQTEPDVEAENTATVGRVVVLGLALAIPGFIAVTRPAAARSDRLVLGGIVFCLTALAILRIVRAIRGRARWRPVSSTSANTTPSPASRTAPARSATSRQHSSPPTKTALPLPCSSSTSTASSW